MFANTVDPIVFLETQGKMQIAQDTITTKQELAAKIAVKNPRDTIKEPVRAVIPEPISTVDPSTYQKSKKYQYQVIWLKSEEIVESGRKFAFFIKIYDVNDKSLHRGKLAHRIAIADSEWNIAFDKPVITTVDNGIIKVTGVWLKTWSTILQVKVANTLLGRYNITVE